MTNNRFRDGFTGETTTATMPASTPEQEEAAARKLERSRALRAERRAAGELPPIGAAMPESAETLAHGLVPGNGPESEALSASVPSETDAKVSGDRATPDDGMSEAELAQLEAAKAAAVERADLERRADAINLRKVFNYGPDTSLKGLRRKVEDAETAARSEAAAMAAPPPPDAATFHAAEQRHHDANARLHTLQSEQAGIQGQIDDAVASGVFDQVATLRARQSELPWLIEIADLDAARLAVPLSELWMARTRHEKKMARTATSERRAEIEKLQADLWAIVNGEAAADAEHADAVIAHGQALDRVRQLEAAMKQPAPAPRPAYSLD